MKVCNPTGWWEDARVGTGDSPVPGNPPQSVYLPAVMAKAWTKRVAPAVGLFFVAPLVAEFLLGNLPINLLGVLLILAPLYGGGALLIREVVRRTDRGWPTIFMLALAFGVLEEAFTTQSLFNPNYLRLNLHLLDRAYIPALGIGGWWTVFVLRPAHDMEHLYFDRLSRGTGAGSRQHALA